MPALLLLAGLLLAATGFISGTHNAFQLLAVLCVAAAFLVHRHQTHRA